MNTYSNIPNLTIHMMMFNQFFTNIFLSQINEEIIQLKIKTIFFLAYIKLHLLQITSYNQSNLEFNLNKQNSRYLWKY